MALMLKVCDMRTCNTGGDPRYRYMTGRIDDQTRIVLMPNRDKPDSDEWTLYIAPEAEPPTADAEDIPAEG